MNNRLTNIQGTLVAAMVAVGLLAALSLPYALPVAPQSQHASASAAAGASVHAKNGATPGWILDLQSRSARQLPVTVRTDEPSFWI